MTQKYFLNGFGSGFLLDTYKRYLSGYDYFYYQPKSWRYDFINNYIHLKKMKLSGQLSSFDVLHSNIWSNMTNMIPNKDQIGISHWHGFSLGVNPHGSLKHSDFLNRKLGGLLSRVVEGKIQNAIQRYDLVYAAIPSVLPVLKKIRYDAQWMPNPINVHLFNPIGQKLKLEGNPVVLFPTRLHKVKEPEEGLKIFSAIKKEYPFAKLHLIRYPDRYSQYWRYKDFLEQYSGDIIWHDFYQKSDLPKLYRAADIVLGSFWQGVLSLVELEAMACGVPVICKDDWEIIKKNNFDLLELSLKILNDSHFRNKYIKRCTSYVQEKHSQEKVCELHKINLDKTC